MATVQNEMFCYYHTTLPLFWIRMQSFFHYIPKLNRNQPYYLSYSILTWWHSTLRIPRRTTQHTQAAKYMKGTVGPSSLMQAVCWRGGDWCRPIPRSWTEFALSKEKLGQAWPWCWKGCCPSAQAFTHCLPARADTLSVTQTQEWECHWCAPDTLSCQHCRAACRHHGNNASSALRTFFYLETTARTVQICDAPRAVKHTHKTWHLWSRPRVTKGGGGKCANAVCHCNIYIKTKQHKQGIEQLAFYYTV